MDSQSCQLEEHAFDAGVSLDRGFMPLLLPLFPPSRSLHDARWNVSTSTRTYLLRTRREQNHCGRQRSRPVGGFYREIVPACSFREPKEVLWVSDGIMDCNLAAQSHFSAIVSGILCFHSMEEVGGQRDTFDFIVLVSSSQHRTRRRRQ